MTEVFDLHTDTLSEWAGYSGRRNAVNAQSLQSGNVSHNIFACFCGTDEAEAKSTERILKQAQAYKRYCTNGIVNGCGTKAHLALEGLDYISTVQGLTTLLDALPPLLYAGLVWNRRNKLGGSCYDDAPLTPLGRQCVKLLTSRNIYPDLAHAGQEMFYSVADICTPLVTHACFKDICDVPRNITRQQLNLIIQKNGLIGVTFYTAFAGRNEDSVADNIIYALEAGAENCLALGSDFDGCEALPPYLTTPEGYPALCERLLRRGVSQSTVNAIFNQNATKFFNLSTK